MESKKGKANNDENKSVKVLRGATDLQRLKLEKLMKNPNKEAFIPEKSKEKEPRAPHEFIRNVWGSSAGAGSGDFHVYRGVRRREYARQKFINEKAERTEKDEEFHIKVEENQKAAEERTAKKRAKRDDYEKSYRRYVVFVCSLFLQFFVIGMPSSMLGIMYVDIMKEFRAGASETALMLSLYRGLSFGGCIAGNLIMRYFGEFPCMMVGSLLGSFSFIVAMFAQNVTTVVLLVGVGAGCGFMFPLLLGYSNIGRAFSGKAATQFLTLTAIGGGIGLIITPYITELLLRKYQWRGTCLISGGIFLNLLVIGVLVQINLPDGPKKSKTFNGEDQKAIFKSKSYLVMLFSMVLFGLFGFIEPWFLPDFLVSNGYNQKDAALLMTIIGACNLFGRILAGLLEPLLSRTKLMYHWIYIFTLMGLSHAAFPYFIHLTPALILASVVYGITFGMVVSQSAPVIVQSLSSDLYLTGLATELTIYGGCTNLGGYVGGMIRDVTGGYEGVFYIASLSAFIVAFSCGILMSVEKLCQRKTQPCVHIPSLSTITHL